MPKSEATEKISTQHHGRHRFGQSRNHTHIDQGLLKSGILIAIGITIHNIPEGIAVGAGYMHEPAFGIFIALAILLHNIPEGIATALPLCKSGVCRWDSFRVAFLFRPGGAGGGTVRGTLFDIFPGLHPRGAGFCRRRDGIYHAR